MNTLNPEIVEASVTGVLKTFLILIGVFVLLRFLGRVNLAKKAMENERESLKREKEFLQERNAKLKRFGKVSVMKSPPKGDVKDVDFEEVK